MPAPTIVSEPSAPALPTPEPGPLVTDELLLTPEPLVTDELLVEEISIDGMCGVY